METYDLSKLNAEDFKSCLNQNMNIHFSGGETLSCEIIKVTELNGYSPLERGAFSVVFQTTADTSYREQGIHQIDLPKVKGLDIFLVPVSVDKNGMNYEAVFS